VAKEEDGNDEGGDLAGDAKQSAIEGSALGNGHENRHLLHWLVGWLVEVVDKSVRHLMPREYTKCIRNKHSQQTPVTIPTNQQQPLPTNDDYLQHCPRQAEEEERGADVSAELEEVIDLVVEEQAAEGDDHLPKLNVVHELERTQVARLLV